MCNLYLTNHLKNNQINSNLSKGEKIKMKRLLIIIFTIILTLTMILITASYSVESAVVNTLSSELTCKKVSGRIYDFVINYDMNKLDEIDKTIKNSKQIPKITKKFLNATIENTSYNKNTMPDVSNEIDSLVNNELADSIDKDTRNEIISKFNNYGSELESNFEIYLSGFSYNYTELFKIYYNFVSSTFRIILFIILCIDLTVLIFIQKLESLKYIKVATIITFVLSVVILITIKFLQNYIDQNFAGGRLNSINTNSIELFSIIWLVLSVTFIIIDKKMKSRLQDK